MSLAVGVEKNPITVDYDVYLKRDLDADSIEYAIKDLTDVETVLSSEP